MSVHFPIALSFVALGLYVYDLIMTDPNIARTGFLLHGFATLGAVLAIFTGRNEKRGVPEVAEIVDLVQTHEILAYSFVWLMAMLLIWQYLRFKKMKRGEKLTFVALFLVAMGILTYGSSLGGQLVFEKGVGVVS